MKSRLIDLPDWDYSILNQLGVIGSGVQADSRLVQEGDVFLACPGEYVDGRQFIAEAIQRGAKAVLWDSGGGFNWHGDWYVLNLPVDRLSERAGIIADYLLGYPSEQMRMIGVTGTNGKTSITHWLAQAFAGIGLKAGLIGTIGNGFYGSLRESGYTTPAPVKVQQQLAEFRDAGAQVVAMEVSSHGLDQSRVNGVRFHTAVFTNLSRDHFDYHHDFDTYWSVKKRLFFWEDLSVAIINADDKYGNILIPEITRDSPETKVVSYGLSQSDVRAVSLQTSINGIEMELVTPWGNTILCSHLIGKFNAYNLMACLTVLCMNEVSLADAVNVLSKIQPATGRMQRLGGADLPLVVVDYAHTPDALEKALSTLKEIKGAQGRLICVFGCGGDRDPGKRALMGEAASRLADSVVVTSDNPRSEDPLSIIDDILSGVDNPAYVDADRAAAIRWAIQHARKNDIILIAGKGHEEYQDIKGVKTVFSDKQVAERILVEWKDIHVHH